MAILLIRHGETLGNRNRVVQVPETPLSEHGLDQAARLGRRLASSPIREIWTSPQPRARSTAAALERAMGLDAREVVDLEERSFGAVRGTPYSELGFDLMAEDFDPPEGESWPVFHARVDRVWEQVESHWKAAYAGAAGQRGEASGGGEHLAVVSHGLVCRSLLERRLLPGAALSEFRDENDRIFLPNTALTIIEPRIAPSGALEYELPLVGCTAHLEGDQPEASGVV